MLVNGVYGDGVRRRSRHGRRRRHLNLVDGVDGFVIAAIEARQDSDFIADGKQFQMGSAL